MVTKTDANTVDSSTTENDDQADSSTVDTDVNEESSASESAGSRDVNEQEPGEEVEERLDKNPRFRQVNERMKAAEAKAKELEEKLNSREVEPKKEEERQPVKQPEVKVEEKKDFMVETISELKDIGYHEEQAKRLATLMWKMTQEGVSQRVQPIESHFTNQMVDKLYQKFGEKYPETFENGNVKPDIEKKLDAVYLSLTPDMQKNITKAGVEGLEYLYWKMNQSKSQSVPKTEKIEVNKKLGSNLGKTRTSMSETLEKQGKSGKEVKDMEDDEYEDYRLKLGLGKED